VADRSQIHEVGAIGEVVPQIAGDGEGEGEAGLARSPRLSQDRSHTSSAFKTPAISRWSRRFDGFIAPRELALTLDNSSRWSRLAGYSASFSRAVSH
jgi:hypothetical protein